ncbi:hypothetical protein GQ600_18702 [Phytophthora cactorum]|nr:hypothetical protein GQ600_18702 [Phytophthora cactorum]
MAAVAGIVAVVPPSAHGKPPTRPSAPKMKKRMKKCSVDVNSTSSTNVATEPSKRRKWPRSHTTCSILWPRSSSSTKATEVDPPEAPTLECQLASPWSTSDSLSTDLAVQSAATGTIPTLHYDRKDGGPGLHRRRNRHHALEALQRFYVYSRYEPLSMNVSTLADSTVVVMDTNFHISCRKDGVLTLFPALRYNIDLLQKVIGAMLVVPVQYRFEFDANGVVTWFSADWDLISALNAIVSLVDAASILSDANISKTGQIRSTVEDIRQSCNVQTTSVPCPAGSGRPSP